MKDRGYFSKVVVRLQHKRRGVSLQEFSSSAKRLLKMLILFFDEVVSSLVIHDVIWAVLGDLLTRCNVTYLERCLKIV